MRHTLSGNILERGLGPRPFNTIHPRPMETWHVLGAANKALLLGAAGKRASRGTEQWD